MLAKKERLNRADFERFFVSGRRYQNAHLQLVYSRHDTFHGAVVVGKKVHKLATKRNQLRRRVYGALYRAHLRQGLLGVYIISAKPTARNLSQRAVAPAVDELLGLVRPQSAS